MLAILMADSVEHSSVARTISYNSPNSNEKVSTIFGSIVNKLAGSCGGSGSEWSLVIF